MNREIKFKVWDKIDEDIAPLVELHSDWVAIPIMDEDGGHLEQRKLEDVELMQFTGLLDKNGKEIYESDIIQTDVNLKKWIVYEEDYAWYVKNIGSNEKYPLGVYKKLISVASAKLEVIGNIYENKELIK